MDHPPPLQPEPCLDVIERAVANEDQEGKDDGGNGSKLEDGAEPEPSLSNLPLSFVGFSVKYAGSTVSVRLEENDTVTDLRAIIWSLTDVPPESQKLIGLTRGKPPKDDERIGKISFLPSALRPRGQPNSVLGNDGGNSSSSTNTRNHATESNSTIAIQECRLHVTFMLVGTPEAARFKDPTTSQSIFAQDSTETSADVDYLELKKHSPQADPSKDPKNLRRLQKVIERFSNFSVMHEPRPGKKLLVLDLDYTIADTKRLLDQHSPASLAARPGLYDFLAAVWPYYDICIWSQTSWRWLELKLTELNMLADPRYHISFVLDRTPMFSIKTKDKIHEVKALDLIWKRWPELYGPKNTIHIDDISRNFAMNPQNGLKIKPYKHSPCFDTELQALQKYLFQLAHESVSDFTLLNHREWKHFQGPDV